MPDLRTRILFLSLSFLVLLAVTAFMTLGAKGSWSFVLTFRGTKLITIVLVAYSIAVSTVLFQTVTNNRILTPSIMGFDALYALIQTVVVFLMGATHLAIVGPNSMFVIETIIMAAFAGILYQALFSGGARSLYLVMLAGIVFGVMFRSFTNLLQRMIDPDSFAVLQDRFFANFNTINGDILPFAALIILAISIYGIRLLNLLDVLNLGRDTAINLGVEHKQVVRRIFFIVTVLVSVSTALVGPVTFFGLLVANLAYLLANSSKHRIVLPVATMLAILILVGGQVILERVFAFDTALSVIIEFLGGIAFIILLIKGKTR